MLAAAGHVLVKYNVERARLKEVTAITPGNRAPTVSPLDDELWVYRECRACCCCYLVATWHYGYSLCLRTCNKIAVEAMIPKRDMGSILDRLQKHGATDILVFNISNCRV